MKFPRDSRKHCSLTTKYPGTQSHEKDPSVLTHCVLGWVAHKSSPNTAACSHSSTSGKEIHVDKQTTMGSFARSCVQHTAAGRQVIIEIIAILTGALKKAFYVIASLLACVRKECALVHICIGRQTRTPCIHRK